MSDVEHRVSELLRRYGMHHQDIDMQESCDVFLSEMDKGLAGQESSLAMIPTYIETDKELPRNEPVIVLDAGGTNFRAAVIHFDEHGKAVIDKFRKGTMPGVKAQVGKDEFFDTLAGYIKDIADTSSRIGFCFSYACDMQPNKDGRLIRFSKEIKAPEVVGQMIGENMVKALRRLGVRREKRVVILNDTVTALLAGFAGFEEKHYDSYVGFILGTGTNTCYIEKNSNIIKRPDLNPDKSQIINVESGGFGGAPRGRVDIELDNSTDNPGVHIFEKMISGAYLGPLCLEMLRTAAKDELFRPDTAAKINALESLQTKDVSDFLTNSGEQSNLLVAALASSSESDLTAIDYLLTTIVERAAKLTAINLSAAILKSGKGNRPHSPVCIVAEGTTFYNLKGLKENVEKYLQGFLVAERRRHYEIVGVENATLIGAAIAGLTN